MSSYDGWSGLAVTPREGALMRRIGLVGGASCEATALYYERVNAGIRARLGGLNAGDVLVSSPNFAPLARHRRAGAFEAVAALLADEAEWLVRAGAEVIAICADPMYRVLPAVAERVERVGAQLDTGARLVDAVEETRAALAAHGRARPLILSVQNSLERADYAAAMRRGGIEARAPAPEDRRIVEDVVMNELCAGQVRPASRDRLLGVIERGLAAGADGIVLACPELSFVLDADDLLGPGFDSAAIHAAAVAASALDAEAPGCVGAEHVGGGVRCQV